MQRSKSYRKAAELIDSTKLYEPAEAIRLEQLQDLYPGVTNADFFLCVFYRRRELYPESKTTFFFGTVDAQVTFDRAASGRVTRATFYQAGRRTAVAIRRP